MRRPIIGLATAALALMAVLAAAHASDTGGADAWTLEKCSRYEKAFGEMVEFVGRDGLTDAFLEGNRDFIAAGCANGADVCPTSEKDIELSNALTVAAMNFGTASSFLPFVCR